MNDTPPRDFVPYVPGPAQNTGAFQPVSPAPWNTGPLPAPQPPAPTGGGNRGLLIVIAALLALIVLGGGIGAAWYATRGNKATPEAAASPSAAAATAAATAATSAAAPKTTGPATYTVTGTVTLAGTFTTGQTCAGKGGFNDIHGGALVAVRNAAGQALARGQLDVGIGEPGGCVFLFVVQGVPAGAGDYEIAVGARDGVPISEARLTAPINLSLGA